MVMETLDKTAVDRGLGETVYNQLLERIHAGLYTRGSRLPSEVDLAGEFDVSRPVIRSALARLRNDGLIVSRRGSGSFVTGDEAVGDGFAPLSSIEDFAAWYDYRRVVEAEIAARAARFSAPSKIDTLRKIADDLEELLDGGGSGVEADIRFHGAIAEMAENRFLEETVTMLRPHLYFIARLVRTLGYTGYLSGQTQAREEHRAIIEAIASRDPEAARQAMVRHIDGSQRRVFKGTSQA